MSSFAVGDRDVFIGTDVGPGTLCAIARSTGTISWQRPVPGPVDRPALVGDTLYLASGQGGLLALDIGTGRQRWAEAVDGYAEGVVLTGGLAVVASRDATDAAGTVTAFTDSPAVRCR
jgi:outer membrane protein assembly factor BamB